MHRRTRTLGLWLALAAVATPSVAEELEFVVGAFRYVPVFGVDYVDPLGARHVDQKLKYPLIAKAWNGGDLLLLLAVDPPQVRLYAYRPGDLIDGDGWRRQPVLSRPDSWPDPGELFGEQPPRITAFFRGGAFAEEDDRDRITVRRTTPQAETISSGEAVRDYGRWGALEARVTPEGLMVDGTRFFACREVFSVDRNDGLFAIGFQDDHQLPQVCLRQAATRKRCDCLPLSEKPQFEPRFSADGRFLAVATADQKSKTWDLNVYAVDRSRGGLRTQLLEIPGTGDVAFYDITIDAFAYPGSYGWSGRDLFFKRKGRSTTTGEPPSPEAMLRTVYRISCDEHGSRCGDPQPWTASDCVRLGEPRDFPKTMPQLDAAAKDLLWLVPDGGCGGEIRTPALQVDIKEIVWAQPFRHAGVTYLAAQTVVRPRYQDDFELDLKQKKWLSRILIFRLR